MRSAQCAALSAQCSAGEGPPKQPQHPRWARRPEPRHGRPGRRQKKAPAAACQRLPGALATGTDTDTDADTDTGADADADADAGAGRDAARGKGPYGRHSTAKAVVAGDGC